MNLEIKKIISLFLFLSFCTCMTGQVKITKKDVTCRGGNDGWLNVNATNAAQPIKKYLWNDGVDAKSRMHIPAGHYCVTVTDANDCTGVDCIDVNQPETSLSLSIGIEPDPTNIVPCGIPQPVFVTAYASGGGGSFNINGTPNHAVQTLRVAETMNVKFRVTDANGCSVEKEQRVYILPRFCPRDPNEMVGPVGFDSLQWVSVKDTLDYNIKFENDPTEATAPAQRVMITHQFDEDINPLSFRLGSFGWGDYVFQIPGSPAFYQTRLNLIAQIGLYVDVTAGIDVNTHSAFWVFESIDPATGLLPVNPLIGFLPINDTISRGGEGFVNFFVRSKQPGHTRDTILAKANIVFDINEPIVTNIWSNTIDALPPSTTLNSLPAELETDTISLTWAGTDDTGGSGLDFVELYYSKNGAAYQLFPQTFADTIHSYNFQGEYGSDYAFFIVGVDHTGNRETGVPGEASTSILPRKVITLVRPAANEYCIHDTLHIDWSLIQIAAVDISLSIDSGQTFQPLFTNVPSTDTSAYYILTNSLAGEYLQIQIHDHSDTTYIRSSILPIKPLPDVNAGADKSICIGDVAFLIPDGANTYHWSPNIAINNPDLTIPTVNPSTNRKYYVVGTDVFGCRNIDSVLVAVHPFYVDSVVHMMCNEDSVFVGGAYQTIPGYYTDLLASTYGCDSTVVTQVVLTGPCPFPSPQVYVDKDATGSNNGTSWANAFTDLQNAIHAVDYYLNVHEIWIAEGTYKPSPSTNRDTSYVLRDSVAIYGGFVGNETLRTQRSTDPSLVKLSGDIGILNDSTDNAYHVIKVNPSCTDCILDGLTVRFGEANGTVTPAQIGGGLLINGKVLLDHVTIERNTTVLDGAAIYNSGASAITTIRDCLFRLNTSGLARDILNSNGAQLKFEGMNTVQD
ncbi:MAG: SprB repeat-containing protein [Saprospiraceae bacterium]|uniref:SprB repeat-containing protein n=1 Tax=Candidatus Opimibacter skivensis TaxID=2982028 RepID=A0A9D7STD5_9BACT|nr:SprB repeat-containing protein [Candidatus Opimibacter skivensis]